MKKKEKKINFISKGIVAVIESKLQKFLKQGYWYTLTLNFRLRQHKVDVDKLKIRKVK